MPSNQWVNRGLANLQIPEVSMQFWEGCPGRLIPRQPCETCLGFPMVSIRDIFFHIGHFPQDEHLSKTCPVVSVTKKTLTFMTFGGSRSLNYHHHHLNSREFHGSIERSQDGHAFPLKLNLQAVLSAASWCGRRVNRDKSIVHIYNTSFVLTTFSCKKSSTK